MIVDAGEVWWFELPRVGRKPAVVCSRRAVNLRVMPIVARITTAARDRALPTALRLDAGEVEGLDEVSFVLAHDLFTAGPVAPAVAPAGRLGVQRVVELRRVLAWTFAAGA